MTHSFVLRVEGVGGDESETVAEALYSPDSPYTLTISHRDETMSVYCDDWPAPSLREAVGEAVALVLRIKPSARVRAVEAEPGHSLAEALLPA